MKKKKSLVLPLLLAVILLVLVPVFGFITKDRLDRHKEFLHQRMLEKGLSLIRTFEAGTRTGMITMRWGARRIQSMLEETQAQPGVSYVMIVSADQIILAHSDPARVGTRFHRMPDLSLLDQDPVHALDRRVETHGSPPVFEVIKRFMPFKKDLSRWGRRHHDRQRSDRDGDFFTDPGKDRPASLEHDWGRRYLDSRDGAGAGTDRHYIVAGLSLKQAARINARFFREALLNSVILFLVCVLGMALLAAFFAYRSARASLALARDFSDTVVQNMPAGLVTIDPDNRITAVNREARQILGGVPETLYPQWLALKDQIDPALPVVSRQTDLPLAGEETVRLDVTVSSLEGEDGESGGFLFMFKDLSQIQALRKEVETHQRLAAIGKLAAGVAHEIRNPLSSIKGFATYFAQRYKDNESDSRTAAVMAGEVERINRSITQLLEFSKPLAVEQKLVNIRQMIAHPLTLVERDLKEKGIEAQVDIPVQPATIVTDPDRMNQVFLNLFINAVQAMETGGLLRIEASPKGAFLEIRVLDTGVGMDETTLEHLFDPYYTTRTSGTGLGLSIVHRIMENLGGRISVESRSGQGACFILLLPLNGAAGRLEEV